MSGPGRILFVNENLGGHASMHLFLAEELAAAHPSIEAQWVEVPPRGPLRRAFSARWPWLGERDLDFAALRNQLAHSAIVRRRLAAVRPFDVAHVYTQSVGLLSARFLATHPSVVSTDATGAQGAYHLPYRHPTRFTELNVRVAQPLEQRVYDAATLVVAQSEWAAGSLRDAYGVAPERVRVIPFGLPVGPRPRRVPVAGRARQITFVGSTLDRKGGHRVLRVHRDALADRCILNLVTRDHVDPGPRVRVFDDLVPGDARLVDLLAETDVFVFPSEMDNSPYSVLEAMRAGVPVVATHVGALPEMVRHGETGLLVAHDDEDLARAVRSLLDDPVRAEAMGRAARIRVEEHYDVAGTTASLLDVLAEARSRHRPGAGAPADPGAVHHVDLGS